MELSIKSCFGIGTFDYSFDGKAKIICTSSDFYRHPDLWGGFECKAVQEQAY